MEHFQQSKEPARPPWSLLQRRLHWGVGALVLVQYLSQDTMRAAMRLTDSGEAPGFGAFLVTTLHVWGGVTIGLAVLWRVRLRDWRREARTTGLRPWAALITQTLLYLTLLVMVLSGVLHYGLGFALAERWHETGKWVLATLLFLHLSGALWHAVVKRDDVLSAMLGVRRQG